MSASQWPPVSPTYGTYPSCQHQLIAKGREINVIASSHGERCPNCGTYVVFKDQDDAKGNR